MHTFWLSFFLSPPRNATKLSLFEGDWELPNPFPQASVGTKAYGGLCCFGTPIFVSWVHYPDGHSSKETDKN